jgi:ribonuclease HII
VLPVADSKTLSRKVREELSAALLAAPDVQIGIGVVVAAHIDQINILRATHHAMREALAALPRPADFALVDGLAFKGLPVPAEFVVKGDARSASIAAASIVAKVHRDRIMGAYDSRFPGYGFSRNKGYGTAEHLAALLKLGATPIHRQSFAPVARVLHPGATQLQFTFSSQNSEPSAERRQSG